MFVFSGFDQAEDFAPVDEPVLEQIANEGNVLVPSCRELAEGEVVLFETEADRACWIVDLELDQTLLPSNWQCRGFGSDTVGIITKLVMKRREFSDRSIDLNGRPDDLSGKCLLRRICVDCAERLDEKPGWLGYRSQQTPFRL